MVRCLHDPVHLEGVCGRMCLTHECDRISNMVRIGREMMDSKVQAMCAINDAVDNGIFTADVMLQELMSALDGQELTECWDWIKQNWEINDEG